MRVELKIKKKKIRVELNISKKMRVELKIQKNKINASRTQN